MKLTQRQLQAKETKKRIYDTAIELLKEHDYEQVTIAQICKKANVSVGNFYHYYESKEALIMADFLEFDEYVKNEFTSLSFNTSLDAIRQLIYMQTLGADNYGPKVMAQMLRTQLCSNGKYVLEETRFFRLHLIELVKKAIENNELDDSYDSREVAEMILRQSRGILFDWSMRGAPYKASEQALKDLEILFKALKKEN